MPNGYVVLAGGAPPPYGEALAGLGACASCSTEHMIARLCHDFTTIPERALARRKER